MKILVLNCGSSSLKFALIELPTYKVLTSGNEERVGIADPFITFRKPDGKKEERHLDIPNHTRGVEIILGILKEEHFVESFDEIDAIGHRLVHGAERFAESVRITPEVIAKLHECAQLAPLHNPANILGIEAVTKVLPNTPQVGVFDTAFHQTMPEHAYMYALPYDFYEKYRIRRYGFHGISHKYVDERTRRHFNNPHLKNITLHLGNGASMAAVDAQGHCIDTSMGFGPNEGLLMGSRCGDIDSAVVFFLGKKGLSNDEIAKIFNHESGMKGITGSSDARDVEALAEKGDPNGILCLDMYAYRVKKYIGAYAAALNGVDTLIFTAGLGENASIIRQLVCEDLEYLGVKIDAEKNKSLNHPSDIVEIQAPDSKVKIVIVATNEEIQIARDVLSLV